jgi:hypothetical protein
VSKLKIEHGASKVHWVLLRTNIEESIASELDLMCEWSENDRKYVVNELCVLRLRSPKNSRGTRRSGSRVPPRQRLRPSLSPPGPKPTPDPASKAVLPTASAGGRHQSTGS